MRLRRPDRAVSTSDWHLTRHARARAAELGFALTELLEAADAPELSYDQPTRGPHQAVRIRGDVAVGVDLRTLTIVTVVLRRPDAWRHGKDNRRSST